MNYAILTIIMTLLGGALAGYLFRSIKDALQTRGKSRIYLYDPDAVQFRLVWARVRDAEVTIKRKVGLFKKEVRRFILPGNARVGPNAWIMHARHGWALAAPSGDAQPGLFYRGPTDQETLVKDELLQRLCISNPGSYHQATARNRVAQALAANDQVDRDAWKLPAVIVGGVVLMMILGGLIYAMVKLAGRGGG